MPLRPDDTGRRSLIGGVAGWTSGMAPYLLLIAAAGNTPELLTDYELIEIVGTVNDAHTDRESTPLDFLAAIRDVRDAVLHAYNTRVFTQEAKQIHRGEECR